MIDMDLMEMKMHAIVMEDTYNRICQERRLYDASCAAMRLNCMKAVDCFSSR